MQTPHLNAYYRKAKITSCSLVAVEYPHLFHLCYDEEHLGRKKNPILKKFIQSRDSKCHVQSLKMAFHLDECTSVFIKHTSQRLLVLSGKMGRGE